MKPEQAKPKERVFSRVPFKAHVVLNMHPGEHVCDLVDISLKGALVQQKSDWPAQLGSLCSLYLQLGDAEHAITMSGVIAHIEGRYLGMRCKKISLESMTNLRQLMALNMGDEAMLERELLALVHPD